MAAYSRFLGGPVRVQYRQGDILLSATGTFVADSGRSIFLEQHVEQRGKLNYFRWEIPYPYIHRIELQTQKAAAASAGAGGSGSRDGNVVPFPPRHETL
jgi:hypothetical protein